MDTAVSVRGLGLRYGGRFRSPPVDALSGLDLEASAGEIVGILGPNGSGKTTLLKVLCGLLRPATGTVSVLGTRPADRSLVQRVGYMAEGALPFPTLSGLDFLQYMGSLMGLDRAVVATRARHWISRLDLDHAARRRHRTYSQGMARRLALAAAVLAEPRVLLLDEPTAGLDPSGSLEVMLILEELAERGTAVIMASHHLQEVEQICQRVLILKGGVVAAAGRLDELLATREHDLVVQGLDETGLASVAEAARELGGNVSRKARRRHLFALFRELGL